MQGNEHACFLLKHFEEKIWLKIINLFYLSTSVNSSYYTYTMIENKKYEREKQEKKLIP